MASSLFFFAATFLECRPVTAQNRFDDKVNEVGVQEEKTAGVVFTTVVSM